MARDNDFLSSVNRAFSEVRAWRMASIILGLVCMVLSWQLVRSTTHQQVVLVPHDFASERGRVTVTTGGSLRGSSQEYMANVALSDLSLITNFTPENVQTTYRRFLNRLTEDVYATKNTELLAQAERYRTDGMTQSFFPGRVRVSEDGRTVEVEGTVMQALGGKETMRSKITYILTYREFKGYRHVAGLQQK